MKKLLYILLFIPLLSFGQQGGPTLNQIQSNFYTGGIWKPMGTVLYGDLAGETGLEEPSVLYEGNAQLLTGTTGSVFKMMFTQEVGSAQNVMYAESLDGITWQRSSTVCISNHARGYLAKFGSTYYYYCVNATTFKSLDIYTSSTAAPGSWTLTTTGALTSAGAGGMIANSIANMVVVFDGTNYQMLLSGNNIGANVFVTGLWTSASPTGTSWTAYGSNPVLGSLNSPYQEVGVGSMYKIGSTWYLSAFSVPSNTVPNLLPTDIVRYHSTNLTSWTIDNSGNPTYPRSQADEGVGTSTGQTANGAIIEVNGKCYMFYSAVGDGNGIANGIHIKLAIANMTLANLILTNEGNGSGLNVAQQSVYDQVQSDYRYIPNATNVGNNSTWTQGSILMTLDNPNQYGWRLRDYTTNANQTVILPDIIYFNRTGVSHTISGGSSSLNLNAWGSINFNNNSGSGVSALGSWDSSTGNLTVGGGVYTGNGSAGFRNTISGTTSTDFTGNVSFYGYVSANSTSSNTHYNSPSLILAGKAWNTSGTPADNSVSFGLQVITASGSTPTGTLNFGYNRQLGATASIPATLTSAGDFKSINSLGSSEITFANAPASPYTGQEVNFSDATTSVGNVTAGSGTNHVLARYNGTNWAIINTGLGAMPQVLATITGINGKATGTTVLYTVPTGVTCTVTGVYVMCTAASAITSGVAADVGDSTNGAASIYSNTTMTALNAAGKIFQYSPGGVYQSVAAGSTVNFNINTVATGTSQTYTVTLVGFNQ